MSKENKVKRYFGEKITREEQSALLMEVSRSEPRAALLLGATFLEDALRRTIEPNFGHMNKSEIKNLFEEQGGSLYNFAGKIKIGYAMQIIDADIQHDLDIIRNLRNGAAHGLRAFTFETAVVQTEIRKLRVVQGINAVDTRKLFIGAFRVLLIILSVPSEYDRPLGVKTLAAIPVNIVKLED